LKGALFPRKELINLIQAGAKAAEGRWQGRCWGSGLKFFLRGGGKRHPTDEEEHIKKPGKKRGKNLIGGGQKTTKGLGVSRTVPERSAWGCAASRGQWSVEKRGASLWEDGDVRGGGEARLVLNER